MKVGIGYLFGAKDDGLQGYVKTLKTGLSGITDQTGKAGVAASTLNAGFNALQTIQLSRLIDQVGGLQGALDKAAGLGSGPSALESRFAQERTALDKTMRAVGVNAGIMGKDLDELESKAFSMSLGLNRSAEDIGKSLVEFKRRKLTPGDVGLDTFEDLIKVSEVSGLSVEALSVEVKGLQKSYGATEGQVGSFLDRFTAVAQKAGIADEALKGLPGILRTIDGEFAKSVGAETVEDVEDVALSILKLSSGFEELGVAPGDAIESAKGLFKTLFSESEATDKMMAGLQSDFGDIAKEISLVDGRNFNDVLGTLEEMKHDPAAFAMELQKVSDQLDASTDPAFAKRFKETIGGMDANLGFLVESGMDLGKIFGDLEIPAKQAEGAFQSLGREGFRTGRTLEDRMALARDSLDDAFKSIGRPQVVKMVGHQEKAYAKLGETLKTLGERTDFVGSIVRAVSAFSAGGILAVLFGGESEMSETHALLEAVLDVAIDGLLAIAPIAGVLATAGISLVTLAGILAPVVGGLASFFGTIASGVAGVFGSVFIPFITSLPFLFGAAVASVFLFTKALDGSLGPAAQGVAQKIEGMLSGIMDWGSSILGSITAFFDGLDPAAIIDSIAGFFGSAMGMVGGAIPNTELDGAATGATDRLLGAFFKALDAGGGFASRFATEVWGRIQKAFGGTDAKSTFIGIGKAIQDQMFALGRKIPFWVMDLQDFVGGAFKSLIGLAVSQVADADWNGMYEGLVSGVESALSNMGEIRKALGERFRAALDSVNWPILFRTILERGLAIRNDVLGLIGKYYDTLTAKIMGMDWQGFGKRLGKSVTEFLVGGVEDSTKTNAGLFKVMGTFFLEAIKVLGKKEFWVPVGETLVSGAKFLLAQAGAITLFFAGMFEGIGEALLDAIFGKDTGAKVIGGLKTMGTWFLKLQAVATAALAGISLMLSPIGPVLFTVGSTIATIWGGFQLMKTHGEAAFGAVKTGFDAMKGLASSVIGLFVGGASGQASLLGSLDLVKGAFATFKEFVGGLWDGLVDGAGDVLDNLPDIFDDTFTSIAATVMDIWSGVLTFFATAWKTVTSGLEGVGAVLGVLADTFGFTAPVATSPVDASPGEVQEAQKASTGKLLAQADIRSLMVLLQNEFSSQNEILKSIDRTLKASPGGGGGGGGGGIQPELESASGGTG